MQFSSPAATESTPSSASFTAEKFIALEQEVAHLRRQVAWFQRQLFGQKSDKRPSQPIPEQGVLGEEFAVIPNSPASPQKTRIAEHTRSQTARANTDDTGLFFDESKVPVEVIHVNNPELDEVAPEDKELIGEKISYRLAQRPGSYVVLKYIRPVVKRRDTQIISCPLAPVSVLDNSRADVSFIAGMLIDKFLYHQPLYRQHQHCRDAGIRISRGWLTQLSQQAIDLLVPIFDAQLESIRTSRVKAMDETPIKAGPAGNGKMKQAYFWPVYGELDELCFLYYPSRSAKHVYEALGCSPPANAVLQTDGYSAYAQYARQVGLTHAQCWAHARRKLIESQDVEPQRSQQALDWIGALYAAETHIRDHALIGEQKRAYRLAQAKPVVDQLFTWIDKQFDSQGFLPSSPFMAALGYLRERRLGLEVYLTDPDVAIDTNHLERALRVIPMGRKNWLFSWTEVGAKQVGVIQSLLATCRLHEINPYEYLVDVLLRVAQHPASQVEQLIPRNWKQLFAAQPLRSDLERFKN
jgi:transposase